MGERKRERRGKRKIEVRRARRFKELPRSSGMCAVLGRGRQRKAEIIFGVGKTNIFDHRTDKAQVVWEFTIFDFAATEVAENAAEIFMAREGHERTRIGEHAYEAREKSIVGKSVELPLNGIFLIEKPPAAAKLDFSRDGAVLEISDGAGEHVVVGRV